MPHMVYSCHSIGEKLSSSQRTTSEKLARESTRSARVLRLSALSRVAQKYQSPGRQEGKARKIKGHSGSVLLKYPMSIYCIYLVILSTYHEPTERFQGQLRVRRSRRLLASLGGRIGPCSIITPPKLQLG